jgi:hypothetical protein
LAFAAAILGAGEVEIVAQDAQQSAFRIGIDLPARSVYMNFGDPRHMFIVDQNRIPG